MAPVARALAGLGRNCTLVLTGQHPQLRLEDYGLVGYPVVRLGCAGEQDPHLHVRKVTAALLPLLRERDMVVVQGDTSSALGGALAAFTAGLPVAHVEAGLRTHDPLLPWPEEEYRVAIDAQAELLFAPTAIAAENLRAECVRGEIHVTGNTGIDTLLTVEAALPRPALSDSRIPRLLVTCHRRESWAAGLQSIGAALAELANDGAAHIEVVLHPNPHVAATMTQLLETRPGIALLPPSGHSELVRRIRDCDLVLSDSGGIQEEAPTLGTPLLVLRDKTERPEAVASGNAILVGTSPERIIAETRRLLHDPMARAAMSHRTFPFGDGRSGPRIARIIDAWLRGHSDHLSTGIRGTGSLP